MLFFFKDHMPRISGRLGDARQIQINARVVEVYFEFSGGVSSSDGSGGVSRGTAGIEHHMRRVRRTYALNVSRMIDAIMTYFPKTTRVTRPKGGFVLWVQMPESVDSLVLYKQALRSGITLSPGYLFSPSQRFKNFIRLNAACWTEEIERAISSVR